MLILLGTGCLSVSITRTSVVQTESDFLSPGSVSGGASVVKNGPQHPDVFAEGKTTSSFTENEKISFFSRETITVFFIFFSYFPVETITVYNTLIYTFSINLP